MTSVVAQPERKTEEESADEAEDRSAYAAIRRMIRALAVRQAKLDLNGLVAANDNDETNPNKFMGE